MLLNSFDIDPGAAVRTLEIQVGELFDLGIEVDILAVSSRPGGYDPVPGTLIHALEDLCGVCIAELPRQLDFSSGPLKAWISPPLNSCCTALSWPVGSTTRFSRIAVIETSPDNHSESASTLFTQLFGLLSVLPLQGIHSPVVATPLLGAGQQQVHPTRLLPAFLESCRNGFRHVPDLERLVLFDRKQEVLEAIAEQVDQELGRYPVEHQPVQLLLDQETLDGLSRVLIRLNRDIRDQAVSTDIAELLQMLKEKLVTPIALGLYSRRLIERLVVEQTTGNAGLTLHQGIQLLARANCDPWLISCLHQVRVFGNWMGHSNSSSRRCFVGSSDISCVLMALYRVLEDYPWKAS